MQYISLKDKNDIWSPYKTLKFVGIQSTGSSLRKWFRAKNWNAITMTFEKHDPALSTVIRMLDKEKRERRKKAAWTAAIAAIIGVVIAIISWAFPTLDALGGFGPLFCCLLPPRVPANAPDAPLPPSGWQVPERPSGAS